MRKARKKDPGVPDILDRWTVGMEDGIWLGLVEVEMEITFASFGLGCLVGTQMETPRTSQRLGAEM